MRRVLVFVVTLLLLGGAVVVAQQIPFPVRMGGPNWSAVDINGGAIDGTTIGGSSAAAGAFTTLGSANYRTLWIPASDFRSTATNGATYGVEEKTTNDKNYGYYAFDGATEEYIEYDLHMPEEWNLGTVKAKVHWYPQTGSSESDTCEWEVGGIAIADDGALDTSLSGTQVISDAVTAGTTGDLHITAATPAITFAGTPALAKMIHLKVSRNVGGTDDMTEDGRFLGVMIQYREVATVVSAW